QPGVLHIPVVVAAKHRTADGGTVSEPWQIRGETKQGRPEGARLERHRCADVVALHKLGDTGNPRAHDRETESHVFEELARCHDVARCGRSIVESETNAGVRGQLERLVMR